MPLPIATNKRQFGEPEWSKWIVIHETATAARMSEVQFAENALKSTGSIFSIRTDVSEAIQWEFESVWAKDMVHY